MTLSPDGTAPVSMLECALEYARRGCPVFPLHTPMPDRPNGCSCKGETCSKAGKHPRNHNGFKGATIEAYQIRKWWTDWPDANIAIVTGKVSDVVVIDIDNKHNGSENLAALALEIGGIPPTLAAATGNGQHLYFRYPGVDVKCSTSDLADGIDVRGNGGYVVAPPSLHANGKVYAWANQEPLAELPPALLARMTPTANVVAIDHLAPVEEGRRNRSLFDYGCYLRGQRAMEFDELLLALRERNATDDPPSDDIDVIRITASVCKRYLPEYGKTSQKRQEHSGVYWFKFNAREWLSNANTLVMSDYQRGWYMQLKAVAFQAGGYLTYDMEKLSRLAGAASLEFFMEHCEIVLEEFEQFEIDGVLKRRHSQLAEEYAAAQASCETARQKGIASGLSKARTKADKDAKSAALAGLAATLAA